MKLIEHIQLIEYYTTQTFTHIQAKKYYRAYLDLDEIQVHADEAKKTYKRYN